MVPTGCVSVVKETLSSQLPDLRGGFFPPCHYRQSFVETEWREVGEDGSGTGNPQAGASSASPAIASPGGETQPPAAQQRDFWEPVIATAMRGQLCQTLYAVGGHRGMGPQAVCVCKKRPLSWTATGY